MSVCSSAVLASTPMVPVYVRSGNGTLEVHQTSVRPGTGYAGVVTALEHGAMPHGGCSSANTVFDFGFFDGADSRYYMTSGFCVVGVEADATLVADATSTFQTELTTGQLRLVNVAIALRDEDADTEQTFFENHCTKEWNSFLPTVGCRSCAAPHHMDEASCTRHQVTTVSCASIFAQFGVPVYLKLDVEGAETGCFEALSKLAVRPSYLSVEATGAEYVDAISRLGYPFFKLVRQDRLASLDGKSTSGPFGDAAEDCRSGPAWRSFAAVRRDMIRASRVAFDSSDPCPGGVLGIDQSGNGAMWYDVHAKAFA
eukprot:CAMPEP_0204271126 /NCGR_PEP_ID=MMETSP0468-20130131/19281_1 /ASSEMBLY_ACC=CAM_ASM_000383 /TAXON_ID=2969 /ORGANISM="Oxyrrhis marina" /LENGTH=312 /DNA_ID=CAMNT_0051246743 /DNA_START=97 /DNA_END=1035 /DNA_ORIENTATION=-